MPTGWHSTNCSSSARGTNEGGKVLLPATPPVCSTRWRSCTTRRARSPATRPAGVDPRRCLPLFGSFFGGDTTNDALQYYLGGTSSANDGLDRRCVRRAGRRRPVHGLAWGLDDPVFAGNTPEGRRSSPPAGPAARPVPAVPEPSRGARQAGRPVRPAHRNPVRVLADRRRLLQEAHPRDRRAGSRWVADLLDVLRHRGGVGPPVRGGAHPGGDDWTTLPDANGHTTTATGQSCPAGWVTLHPHLAHYQTLTAACTATGTTGAWNAASGNSAGWQQWSIDLSAYAGETVEISIAYASDWATQGIGVFLDDITLPRRHQHFVRVRPRRLGDHRAARGQRTQRQQLHPNRRSGLPGRQRDRHAALAAARVRTGGRLDCRRTQRSDGPSARPPAGLGGVRHVRSLRAGSAPKRRPSPSRPLTSTRGSTRIAR